MLTPEMIAWLTNSRDDYEFYLLHAMLHDPVRRAALQQVPLIPDDFVKEEMGLVLAAINHATKVLRAVNMPMPEVPTVAFFLTYIASAANMEGVDREVTNDATRLMFELVKPEHRVHWYCIDPYFEAWYGAVQGKRIARKIQTTDIPDMQGAVTLMQRAMTAAANATLSDEDDEMTQVMDGQDFDVLVRRTTGIAGLDLSLNGGWGPGECYLLFGGTGGGKCHGIGTPIMMTDGTVRLVEDVVVGDKLLGPDSGPRIVTELIRGRDEMFRITPHRGADPVVVNSEHTLTLAVTNIGERTIQSADGVVGRSHCLIDVKLSDYLRSNKKFRHCTKWVQTGIVEFDNQSIPLEIPPYLLGFWLGDGAAVNPSFCKPGVAGAIRGDVEEAGWVLNDSLTLPDGHCETVNVTGGLRTTLRKMGLWGNKHVPQHYLTASRSDRELLLAGLLDTDGSVHRSGWEFSNTNKQLTDSVVFLARSLGHSASSPVSRITTCQTGASCLSWRTHISQMGSIPTKLKHPPARRQQKNPLTNGFRVESLGIGDYYGFSVEGRDKRYLLGDFSITHNSVAAGQCCWHEALMGGYPLIVSTELRPREYVSRMVSCAASVPINIIQDCANFVQIRSAVGSQPGMAFKEPMVDRVLNTVRERIRIYKVSADAGMDSRSLLERAREKYKAQVGVYPTWICFDWLGTLADVGGGGKGTSERAMAWEIAANSCVAFADTTDTPTLVLAQAVNDAQLKRILTINDIGISKGIAKSMVAAIGVTNTMDQAGVKAAVSGQREMPSSMILEDQFFCTCKARKGEGANIPVQREFRYQRFRERPRT